MTAVKASTVTVSGGPGSPAVESAVAALRDQVREAAAHKRALRIAGRGTWLDAGRPVVAADTISTRELTGIVEYVPGDLTLTARAGTTLGEIRDATAANNQWLALDPHGSDEGTIGATAATASAGPLATAFGAPRDLLLGIEFITGAGAVARGGGKVVKNVAGFDLTRLLTGSWGTLGVITEVTVRLHARPEVDRSFSVALDGHDDTSDASAATHDVERVRALLRRASFRPNACEILNAALARRLLGAASPTAIFRLGGNADAVDAQRAALAELGPLTEIDAAVWPALRAAEPPGALVVRLSRLPTELGLAWREAAVIPGALVHASPLRGIVRVIGPAQSEDSIARMLATSASTRIGERLSASLWASVPRTAAGELRARIKSTFDPSNALNPGILGVPA